MQISVNLNDSVWVSLTLKGVEVFYEYQNQFPKQRQAKLTCDVYGYSEFILHELMHIFGSKMIAGSEEIFQNGIICFTKPK